MTNILPTTTLDLDSLLAQIVDRARELMPFDSGGIVTYDPEAETLSAHIYWGRSQLQHLPKDVSPGEGFIGKVAQTGQPVQVQDPAIQAAPMLFDGQLLGVFVAESREPGVYTDQHLKILQTLADQAALAVNTARLYKVLARRYERLSDYNEELYLRNEVSRLASSDEPLDTLLPQMAARVAHLVGVDAVALTLWDKAEGRARRLSAYGLDLGDYLSERKRPAGAMSLTETLVQTGKTIVINNAQSLENPPTPFIQEYEARAVLAMPLVARGRTIGGVFMLNLSNDDPFTELHADHAASMLDQIAMTIDNRVLFQDIQDRLSETSALLEIAARAASSLHFDEILGHVLKISQEMLDLKCGAFLLFNRQENVLEVYPGSTFGVPDDLQKLAFPVNQPGSHIAIVFNSGSPYFSNDLRTATQDVQGAYYKLLKRLSLRNLMLTPLRVQDEPMGVFLVGNKRGDFTRADAQLLMAMGSHVAASLRNTELLNDTRERLRETEALQRIAAITSSTLNLDEMLGRAVREAAELLGTEGAVLMMHDDVQNALVVHEQSRYGIAQSIAFIPLPLNSDADESHFVRVYKTRRPYTGDKPGAALGLEWRNIITFPLNVRDRTLGVLSLINRQISDFEEMHADLTRAIASQIATSMENAQLFAAERKRADLMALVNKISQELTATLSLTDLTHKIVQAIHERLGYETVNIMLLDDNGLNLTVRSSVSSLPKMTLAEGQSFSISEGIVGKAMRTGETQLVPDISGLVEIAPMPIGSALVVPLRYGSRILGLIEALKPRLNGFRETDSLALETLAAQVSIAIENARLWDQARRRLLEQGIVHQIGQDLTAILDYHELVNAVVKHMTRALDTALCVLISHNPHTELLAVEAEYRLPDVATESSFAGRALDSQMASLINRAVRTRRQVTLSHAELSVGENSALALPIWRYLQDNGIHSMLILPMVAGDLVIGCVVWIETREHREFSGSDVRLAQTLTSQAAIAIENARLFQQAHRQAHEQAMLRRVAVGLSIMPDVHAMLNQFAYEVAQALSVENVAIAMRGSDGWLRMTAHNLSTCEPEDMLLTQLCTRENMDWLTMLETGACVQMSAASAASSDEAVEYFAKRSVTVLLVPIMRRRREIIGVIEASVDAPTRIFDMEETQLLEALSNQGAIAFDNLSYHSREQARLRQLERLQVSGRKIAGQLRTALLLDLIVKEAAEIFDAPAVSLGTRDGNNREKYYRMRATVGLSERYVRERLPDITEFDTIREFTTHTYKPLLQHNPEQIELVEAEGLTSLVAVPLIRAGQQLGVLSIYGKSNPPRIFTDEEKELALLFAGQAVIALENAMLFEALEERARELTKANKLKSEFLARVSHELRTPMNSINGYSEMLLRQIYGPVNEKQQDRVERILRNGRNLLALIDDLLDLSKIDAGKMELTIESVSLRDEIAATIYNLESQASSKGLYMRLEVSDELPSVRADTMRLRQIITNLLSNAIKFTKTGGVTTEVKVVEENGQKMVWTTVRDTGIGIRPEDQTIIFDEFRQADGSTTREYGGTGLGLAISKKLVELMAGRIWVESEHGNGSAFIFVLPGATS